MLVCTYVGLDINSLHNYPPSPCDCASVICMYVSRRKDNHICFIAPSSELLTCVRAASHLCESCGVKQK